MRTLLRTIRTTTFMGCRFMSDYRVPPAFEPATMQYFADGIDADYKQDVREKLVQSLSLNRKLGSDPVLNHIQVIQRLRLLSTHNLISFSEIASTPRHFMSFFEVLASFDSSLALVAADHFLFSTLLAKYGRKDSRRGILDGVDSFRTLGTVAVSEILTTSAPFNTEARFDTMTKSLTLRGSGKFSVCSCETASWAIVAANLTIGKRESRGSKLFVVRLRDDSGDLMPGVSVRPLDRVVGHDGCGLGIVHFEDVQISADDMLLPYTLLDNGDVIGGENIRPLDDLSTQRTLALCAILVGMGKRMLTDAVNYVCHRRVEGPTGVRDHLLMGQQSVQTELVEVLARFVVGLSSWHHLTNIFCDPMTIPNQENNLQLLSIRGHFEKTIEELATFINRRCPLHGALGSSRVAEAQSLLALCAADYANSSPMFRVGVESVLANIGTSHWGWRVTSSVKGLGVIKRLLQNPFFSPHLSDMGRHLILAGHKHYTLKSKLSRSRRIEERHGQEHVWYDWHALKYRDVESCGDAFTEVFLIDSMMKETTRCLDLRGRRLLRDINWTYSLSCMQRSNWVLVREQLLSPRRIRVVTDHFDNLCTLIAPQCLNIVESLRVPKTFLSPLSSPLEQYYYIPGTTTGYSRVEDVVPVSVSAQEEKSQEEDNFSSGEDFDILHGLGDEKAPRFK